MKTVIAAELVKVAKLLTSKVIDPAHTIDLASKQIVALSTALSYQKPDNAKIDKLSWELVRMTEQCKKISDRIVAIQNEAERLGVNIWDL